MNTRPAMAAILAPRRSPDIPRVCHECHTAPAGILIHTPASPELLALAETIESMHGRLHHVIVDCLDPRALARFYSALLNHPITHASDEFMVVAANDTTSGLAFQLAPDHRAPTWPDTAVPQQMHLDIMVETVANATPHVLGLGATKLDGKGVFADPAGHPFCLVKRPGWAKPISD